MLGPDIRRAFTGLLVLCFLFYFVFVVVVVVVVVFSLTNSRFKKICDLTNTTDRII